MSRNARLGVLAAVVAAAVLAFVLLRPGDDDTSTSTTATTTAPAAVTTTTPSTTTTTTTTAKPAEPAITRIRVVGKEPVGGVKDITVTKGDRIRLVVTSDQQEHVHMHGYDIERPVGPGEPATFSVPATIVGVFEVELEDSGVQLAKLTVEP